MYLQATINCQEDGTPYRVYINDELITERFYTLPSSVLSTISHREYGETHYFQPEHVKNVLNLEIKDAPDYSVRIETIPGHKKTEVKLLDVKWQEQPYEDQ